MKEINWLVKETSPVHREEGKIGELVVFELIEDRNHFILYSYLPSEMWMGSIRRFLMKSENTLETVHSIANELLKENLSKAGCL